MMSPTSSSLQAQQEDDGPDGLSLENGYFPTPSATCHSPSAVPIVPSSIVDGPTTMSAFAPGDGDIPNDPGKMFIGGLSWQTTPESIREYFSLFGELAEVMVMKDPATRRSRGFGFITFSDVSSVEKVLSFPVHQLDGKNVEPKVAVPRKTNPKLVMRTKKIFVGGLSAKTSLEDVKSYFEQFCAVKDAMLAYDKLTNRHRGFGFVTFDNDEVVDKICEIHYHEINGKMVESKKAIPRGTNGGYMSGPVHYMNSGFSPSGSNFSPNSRSIYGFANGNSRGYGQSNGFNGSPQSMHDHPSREIRGFQENNAYYNSRHQPNDSLAENASDLTRYSNRVTSGKFSQHYYNNLNYKDYDQNGTNKNYDDDGFQGGQRFVCGSNGSTASSGNNLEDFPPLNNDNSNHGLISSI